MFKRSSDKLLSRRWSGVVEVDTSITSRTAQVLHGIFLSHRILIFQTLVTVMARRDVLAMGGIAFSAGLLLGLLLHLPGVSFNRHHNEARTPENPTADIDVARLASARPLTTSKVNATTRLSGNNQPYVGLFRQTRFNNRENPGNKQLGDDARGTSDLDLSRIIVDGIFWSREIETNAPDGFSDDDLAKWRRKTEATRVVSLDAGCGMMQNRHIVFDDSMRACARYRINVDQIQGDIFSFYLSRLLGMRNVPPSVLATADGGRHQWSSVDRQLVAAQWNPTRAFVVIPWVTGLAPAFIPPNLRPENRTLHPTTAALRNKTRHELVDLMQWTDLIIFDYLTANVDRVVNNMFNHQWNDHMMDRPAHNLHHSSGLLVFLDNESGLFHSYRLLDKYAHYHNSLLSSVCVFRRSVAERVRTLYREGDIGTRLVALFEKHEPLHRKIPTIPLENMQILHRRLGDVYRQIEQCQHTFPS